MRAETDAAVRDLILPPSVRKVLAEHKTRVSSRWLFPSPKAAVQEDTATAQAERTMTIFQTRKRWSREAS